MRRVGHVAHVMESRNIARVLVGRPEGKRDYLVDLGTDWRIILRHVSKK